MWTIAQYISAARILLQDTTAEYRYTDDMLKLSLDLAIDEARRIRPDFFVNNTFPTIVSSPDVTPVPVPGGYMSAFVFYMVGWTQLQDQEDTTDQRSTVFVNKFTAQLLTAAA